MKKVLVFGVLNDSISTVVRQHQKRLSCLTGNQLALKFPVHITLRGPFWTTAEMHIWGDILTGVCRLHRRAEVLLNGPVYVDPDLCWLEVNPISSGFPSLLDMHRHFEDEVTRYIVTDDVPPNHKANNYRPHVTVGWGVDFSIRQAQLASWESNDLTGTLEKVAIAAYPEGWPSTGNVEIIKSVALDAL